MHCQFEATRRQRRNASLAAERAPPPLATPRPGAAAHTARQSKTAALPMAHFASCSPRRAPERSSRRIPTRTPVVAPPQPPHAQHAPPRHCSQLGDAHAEISLDYLIVRSLDYLSTRLLGSSVYRFLGHSTALLLYDFIMLLLPARVLHLSGTRDPIDSFALV